MDHSFGLEHIALVLFLTLLGGLFFQRLRQPALVGYMMVGALIGPGLLGLQSDDATIRWLAELAIMLLMFMLGLELNIRRARASLLPGVTIAVAQVAFALAAMGFLAFVLDWSLPQAILFGFIAALSSTAVAVTMMEELKETDGTSGQLATAVLVAQDVLVIPMLLVISVLDEGKVDVRDFVKLAVALGVVALSFIGIYWLSRRPERAQRLQRFLTAGTSQPVLTALALCFGAAALSGSIGLSTAYGAFALGLLIGNVGSVAEPYQRAIHPIHDFLMAVFFVSIGLLLDITIILENIVPIALILTATLFLKTFGNLLVLRAAGLSGRDAYVTAALLGQVGEFSFVLLSMGMAGALISRDVYEIGLAVIALSLMVSPLWLSLVRRYLARRGIGQSLT